MPIVRSEVKITGVDRKTVWESVSAFDKYPASMPDVLSVIFLERTEFFALTTWTILLNGSELSWTEKEVFTPFESITFDSVDGDLELFRGEWSIKEISDGLTVSLEIEFDLGIPSLADVLNPIGVQAIQTNSTSMLEAIKHEIS